MKKWMLLCLMILEMVRAEDQYDAYSFVYDSTTYQCSLYHNGKLIESVLSKSRQKADCEIVFEKEYDLMYLWKLNTLVDMVDRVESSVMLYFQGFSPDDAGLFLHFQKKRQPDQ